MRFINMRQFIYFIFLITTQINAQTFQDSLAWSAEELTQKHVLYDPSYYSIDYPNGDVPSDRGVCTDVVIRAFRNMDIDLQKEVHEDMKSNFALYPDIWGLSRPDKNIDHRRVPNLMVYFSRFGQEIIISQNGEDYLPGDIVCWNLGGATTHIGMVSSRKNESKSRYLIVHNIGSGQVFDDVLFTYKIIGHFRYP